MISLYTVDYMSSICLFVCGWIKWFGSYADPVFLGIVVELWCIQKTNKRMMLCLLIVECIDSKL